MQEYKQRQEAVRRYKAKEKIARIAKSLGKSRRWVYLWIDRYEVEPDNPDWYKDHSKAPKHKPTKISSEQESHVISIRESLENQQYAQTELFLFSMNLKERAWLFLPYGQLIGRSQGMV
jgi:transposase